MIHYIRDNKKVIIAALVTFIVILLISGLLYRPPSERVFITRTGEKYHNEDCRFLNGGKDITKEQAVKKEYEPCKECQP